MNNSWCSQFFKLKSLALIRRLKSPRNKLAHHVCTYVCTSVGIYCYDPFPAKFHRISNFENPLLYFLYPRRLSPLPVLHLFDSILPEYEFSTYVYIERIGRQSNAHNFLIFFLCHVKIYFSRENGGGKI